MGSILLVRHGQASFGTSDYDRLSPLGVEQSRVLGEALRSRLESVDVAVTGSMSRHKETAAACLSAMGAAHAPTCRAGFDEFDPLDVLARVEPRYASPGALFTDLRRAGERHDTFQRLFAAAIDRWVGGEHDAEYRESWTAFRTRCLGALDDLARDLDASQTALVFTSGGPISAIVQHLLALPDPQMVRIQWTLVNTGVTKLVRGAGGLRLASLNEQWHLEGREGLLTYL